VQPLPAPAGAGPGGGPGGPGGGPGGGGGAAQAGGQAGPGQAQAPARSPFGAGCPTGGGGFGGGGFGGGAATAGPFVLPGTYTVSLLVDGKTVDSKPLRVTADPEVALTDLERRKMFDMAMELHEMQRRANEAAGAFTPFNRRLGEIAKELGSKADVPAEVKASFDAFNKEATALAPKLAAGGGFGGGGFGGGGRSPSVVVRIGQAKNAMMAGMYPTDQSLRTYAEVKAELPKAIAEFNGLLAKAAPLGASLATYKITLTVPPALR
jgi:hypothetical protein